LPGNEAHFSKTFHDVRKRERLGRAEPLAPGAVFLYEHKAEFSKVAFPVLG
jgi:hypothetical protein